MRVEVSYQDSLFEGFIYLTFEIGEKVRVFGNASSQQLSKELFEVLVIKKIETSNTHQKWDSEPASFLTLCNRST